ncbi:hypothetical protein [Robiginitalea marina]|uniref:Serine--tRNA ligase n=1 Tax=Robiginitalea marina TaxID=2954105 RepID=A0ABT1AZI7_9FLAO|nr:hypothetical protein [Robiginitalea marina]MCO5724985.1 hypothetical protein [Robiginitalea marina]
MVPILEKAKVLMKIREQLVNSRSNLNKYLNKLIDFDPELVKLARQNTKEVNNSLGEEIKKIEADIQA